MLQVKRGLEFNTKVYKVGDRDRGIRLSGGMNIIEDGEPNVLLISSCAPVPLLVGPRALHNMIHMSRGRC